MNEKDRSEEFRAMLDDHRDSDWYFEETDGELRLWKELSAQAKLEYIATDAARQDVPFKHFDEAVREVIGDSALTEAALRTVLRDAREFRSLDRLLPPDARTESTPLVERFKEILRQPPEAEREREHGQDQGIEI